MAHTILTPISLWKDFDSSLDLEPEIFQAYEADGILYCETTFSGRQTERGRVRVYGVEVRPAHEEKLPALLLLTQANRAVDLNLAARFAKRGYCVFCMDYRGATPENTPCTQYPEDIDYANYLRSGRSVLHADEGAKKTAWYEWTAAAIYAVKYLKSLPYITSVGAMGVREGGEILWKLMTISPLACGICINAAGWLAHRNVYKFGEEAVVDMAEEKRLFVAGIDSQSYAPFVKCPVLMLVATSDVYADADRAYDTYVRINKEQFATIHYSIGYGGTIDANGVTNADMFMDKYLKERQIFIARPLSVVFEDKGDEELCAVVSSDGEGESVCDVVYFAEDNMDAHSREWIKCAQSRTGKEGQKEFYLPLFNGTENAFAFAQAEYSSGFTVSSKITFKKVEKHYKNTAQHSKIIYDMHENGEFFVPVNYSDTVLGGCFWTDEEGIPVKAEGYGQIAGMSCTRGLKTYRIAQRRFAPEERSMLHVSAYCEQNFYLNISVIKKDADGNHEVYTCSVFIAGGGKWKNLVLPAQNFKSNSGSLASFCGCSALQFVDEDKNRFIVTNILWI